MALDARIKLLATAIAAKIQGRVDKSDIETDIGNYVAVPNDGKVLSAATVKTAIDALSGDTETLSSAVLTGSTITFTRVDGSETAITLPAGISVASDVGDGTNETTALNLKGGHILKTRIDNISNTHLTNLAKVYSVGEKTQFVTNLGLEELTATDTRIKNALVAYTGDNGSGGPEATDYVAHFNGEF